MPVSARQLQRGGVTALLLSCMLPPGAATAQRTERSADLLITHARVVDVRTGTVRADQALAVRGDTIVAIGPAAELQRARARRTVDVAGRYVLPALWDMHMHFGGGDSLIAENRLLLPLFVANGIAAVRDAAGDLSSTVLAWRDSVARGELSGPTIFTSGPKLEGINSIWPGDLEVGSRAEVDAGLDSLQGCTSTSSSSPTTPSTRISFVTR